MAQDNSINTRIDQLTDGQDLSAGKIVVRPNELSPDQPTEFDLATEGNIIDPKIKESLVNDELTEPKLIQQEEEPLPTIADFADETVFTGEKIDVAGKKDILKSVLSSEKMDEASKRLSKKKLKKGDLAFNPYTISTDADVAAQIETLAQMDNLQKFERIKYKDIAAELNNAGFEYSDDFVKQMTDPAYLYDPVTKTTANPYEVFKQFHFLGTISKKTKELAKEIADIKANRPADMTDAKRLEFQEMLVLQGLLARKMKKQQIDIARSLGVLREARKPGTLQAKMIEDALNQFGGTFQSGRKNIDTLAEKIANAEDLDTATEIAETMGKKWYWRVADIIPNVYTTGLISTGKSSLRNIGGNLFLGNLTKVENFLTVPIGYARHELAKIPYLANISDIPGVGKIFKNPKFDESMFLQEAFIHAKLDGAMWQEAFASFYQTMVKNKVRDRVTKLNVDNNVGRSSFQYDLGPDYKHVSKGVEYLGVSSTIWGRLLTAEDEFLKVFPFRRSLMAQVFRKTQVERDRLIAEGKLTAQQIDDRIMKMEEKLFKDPDPEMIDEALNFSRYVTNTQQLEGGGYFSDILKAYERISHNPILKVWSPFLRVTSNIIGAASERNPFTFLLTPRFQRDWKAGGVARDAAIARVTLGSGLMYIFNQMAMAGNITGAGPYRWEEREALKKTGWQPYSFVRDRKEMTEEQIAKWKKITNVSITQDKIYISYQGLEPLSLLIAQGATMAEYAKMNPKDNEMDELMVSGVLAASEYIADHPLLSGIGNLVNALTEPWKTGEDKAYGILENMTQTYTEYALGGIPTGGLPTGAWVDIGGERKWVGGAWSGFWKSMETAMDPERSEIKQPFEPEYAKEEGFGVAVSRGYTTAFRKACSQNPLCSSAIPNQLDPITGQEILNGTGTAGDMINPFYVSEGLQSNAHVVLNENRVLPPNIYAKYGTYKGVKLSNAQINNIIYYATKDGKLEKKIVQLGETFINLNVSKAKAYDTLNNIINEHYDSALQKVLSMDSELRMMIKDVEDAALGKKNAAESLNILIGD